MENIISVKNLSQRYGRGRQIYDGLSFDVPKGSILGLLGKNGTGKTTTINILMGFLRPQAGECKIFGEDITAMKPHTRTRIALLLEGHVQYSFMTIAQIEKFYSRFYPRWNRDAYYGLMDKLKVSPGQKISSMSNGQRSQVALGLILAQNADLLVLDDFSLGLDPGYRRLFADYLREFVKAEGKTVFMTSHIKNLRRYTIILPSGKQLPENIEGIYSPWQTSGTTEFHSFLAPDDVRNTLEREGISAGNLRGDRVASLEDAFIGLTGRY